MGDCRVGKYKGRISLNFRAKYTFFSKLFAFYSNFYGSKDTLHYNKRPFRINKMLGRHCLF